MLKPEMATKLNEQLNLEFFSANLYLQMSAWCSDKGFEGASAFLKTQSREEMDHMRRLFDYLNDTGTMPVLGAIEAPPTGYASLAELFQRTYEHEQLITQKINQLAHTAITSQDYSTFNFLQWYVSEQHEEEKLFKSILDKLSLVDTSNGGLFLIDQELKKMNGGNNTPSPL
jgi:ferritin